MTNAPAGVRVLRAADRAASAWRNGGGVTREVAAFPDGAGLDDFDWRVSLADVAEGGPFSRFPGVDRVITVVDGGGMELRVDGVAHRLDTSFRPFAFAGDADTDCRLLAGPIVDLNVMTRRDRLRAAVEIVETDQVLPAGATLVLVLAGEARLSGQTLGRLDAALLPPTHGGIALGSGATKGVTAVVSFSGQPSGDVRITHE